MDVKYYLEFVELAETKNFSEAAENLFISQSVLSKHIKAMEAEFDEKLFDRSSRKVELSDFGKLILPYAKRLLDLYTETRTEVMKFKRRDNHNFKFGAVYNLPQFDAQMGLLEFKKRYPDYSFETVEAGNNELEKMFKYGEINIFTTCIPDGTIPDYEFIPKFDGHIWAYINTANPLSQNEIITLRDLKNEKLILPSQGNRFLDIIKREFQLAGFEPLSPYHGSYDTQRSFAEANLGIALLPHPAIVKPVPDNIRIIPLDHSAGYHLGVGYRKNGLNTAEKAFIEHLIEHQLHSENKKVTAQSISE